MVSLPTYAHQTRYCKFLIVRSIINIAKLRFRKDNIHRERFSILLIRLGIILYNKFLYTLKIKRIIIFILKKKRTSSRITYIYHQIHFFFLHSIGEKLYFRHLHQAIQPFYKQQIRSYILFIRFFCPQIIIFAIEYLIQIIIYPRRSKMRVSQHIGYIEYRGF